MNTKNKKRTKLFVIGAGASKSVDPAYPTGAELLSYMRGDKFPECYWGTLSSPLYTIYAHYWEEDYSKKYLSSDEFKSNNSELGSIAEDLREYLNRRFLYEENMLLPKEERNIDYNKIAINIKTMFNKTFDQKELEQYSNQKQELQEYCKEVSKFHDMFVEEEKRKIDYKKLYEDIWQMLRQGGYKEELKEYSNQLEEFTKYWKQVKKLIEIFENDVVSVDDTIKYLSKDEQLLVNQMVLHFFYHCRDRQYNGYAVKYNNNNYIKTIIHKLLPYQASYDVDFINFNYDTLLEDILSLFHNQDTKLYEVNEEYKEFIVEAKKKAEKLHVYGDIDKGITFTRHLKNSQEYLDKFLEADDIYFLGFGFDQLNLKNLGLYDFLKEKLGGRKQRIYVHNYGDNAQIEYLVEQLFGVEKFISTCDDDFKKGINCPNNLEVYISINDNLNEAIKDSRFFNMLNLIN